MKENKDSLVNSSEEAPKTAPAQKDAAEAKVPATAKSSEEDDDNIATAEELEAFIRDRRKKEKELKETKEDRIDVFGEHAAPENSIDPYLEPDPTLPWVKYEENLFLSRGCRRCPTSYVPVNEEETRSCSKVTATDWLSGIRQPGMEPFDCVEVRFKNNRKDFYRLPDGLEVQVGDVVAVEGVPGHDVGIVCLTGEVCRIQMKKHKVDPASENIRRLFRRAKPGDIERWAESLKNEQQSLLKTRRIAADMGLEMKVNDVEFQGDNSKAIFYYTADERVDFRALIKVLADEFHVRIEMKQIGVRQEAGKVGGLGTCGRELCCSTWLTNFKSVTTSAAKVQQILPNPQKLAGQCGKLKCCLNFECEVYADALKQFPQPTPIRFKKGLALYKKTDVFRGIMWYAYEGDTELYAIKAENVKKIIEMNRNEEYPEKLEDYQVELMSTAALVQVSDSAEYERELRRMADDMSEGNGGTDKGESRGDKGSDKGDRRNDRRNNDRRKGSDRQGDRKGGEQRPKEEQRPRNNGQGQNQGSEQRPKEEQRPRNNGQGQNQGGEQHPKEEQRPRNNNNRRRSGNRNNNPRRSSDRDK